MKQQTIHVLNVLVILLVHGFLGCEPVENSSVATQSSTPGQMVLARSSSTAIAVNRSQRVPNRTPQTILIASFNIQAFGEEKMKDPWVMERITSVIQLFDIVAIQEVRAKDQTLIPRLLSQINASGAQYDYLIGPRLGRSVSKEQYAYIFDTTKVVTSLDASYTIEDSADLLHREPLVARFVTRVPPNVRPFTFSLVNIHTDPDEVKQELPVMHSVLKGIREFEYLSAREDDVILMGDLNASPKQFGTLAQMPGIYWTVEDEPTNTIRKNTYDNILFDRGLTNEYTGRSGVLDLCELFGIRIEVAVRISDHLPIWAEFSVVEQTAGANSQFVGLSGPNERR